ncbi:hypothetical protein F5Y01DRAFT_316933 [Xylaria sp. FL0043]|nr:hypothetical protein F5Y01DRAFT_316933 [Xylaria sp. FL0043]
MSDISDSQISALDLPWPASSIHFTTENDMDTIVVNENSGGDDNDTFTQPRAFSEILQAEWPGEQIAQLQTELKSLEQEQGHTAQMLVEYRQSLNDKDNLIQELSMKLEQRKLENDSLKEQVGDLQAQVFQAKTDLASSDSQLRFARRQVREIRAEASRAKEAELERTAHMQQALRHIQTEYFNLKSIHDENAVATCNRMDWFVKAKRVSDRDIKRLKADVSERELELKRASERITRLANSEVGLQARIHELEERM